MNATAARPNRQPELPKLPRQQRLGSVIASVLVSTALLSSVMLGLTASPTAQAQEPAASRIEVTGTRYDVRALCPAIDDDLRVQLARRLRMLPGQALVEVAFHLDGRRIDGVETRGSTPDARKAIRQAVQEIGCDNAGAGRQRVRFDVVYRWHDRVDAEQVTQRAQAVRVGAHTR